MLLNYSEALERYNSEYGLQKAISKKDVFKIEKGIYSDKANNYTLYELLLKKYPHSVLVKDSAFHYIGFIKDEPEKVHLGTTRSALRIKDKRVCQHFYKNLALDEIEDEKSKDEEDWMFNLYREEKGITSGSIHRYITDNGNEIRLFNLKSLLYDLLRSKNLYERDKFFELLFKFRDCNVVIGLDLYSFLDEYEFDKEIYSILKEINERDWHRSFDKRYGF